jgi:hypothetical protein
MNKRKKNQRAIQTKINKTLRKAFRKDQFVALFQHTNFFDTPALLKVFDPNMKKSKKNHLVEVYAKIFNLDFDHERFSIKTYPSYPFDELSDVSSGKWTSDVEHLTLCSIENQELVHNQTSLEDGASKKGKAIFNAYNHLIELRYKDTYINAEEKKILKGEVTKKENKQALKNYLNTVSTLMRRGRVTATFYGTLWYTPYFWEEGHSASVRLSQKEFEEKL